MDCRRGGAGGDPGHPRSATGVLAQHRAGRRAQREPVHTVRGADERGACVTTDPPHSLAADAGALHPGARVTGKIATLPAAGRRPRHPSAAVLARAGHPGPGGDVLAEHCVAETRLGDPVHAMLRDQGRRRAGRATLPVYALAGIAGAGHPDPAAAADAAYAGAAAAVLAEYAVAY